MSAPPIAQKVLSVGDDLDFGFDYGKAPWLASGDTVVSSSWTVSPGSGLTLHNPTFDTLTTTVWCLAVTAGTYTVENSITTVNSPTRAFKRSFTIQVL
jgi:hypothetical protein